MAENEVVEVVRELGFEAYRKGIADYQKRVADCTEALAFALDRIQRQEAVIKQFADMISPAVTQMPPATKYQPKTTLAPFIDAYRAVYGDPDKDEA